MNRFVRFAAVLGFLLLAASVRADAGPWPRPRIDIRLHFTNLDEFPGHDFYLKYGLTRGNPLGSVRLHAVGDDGHATIEGTGRLSPIWLVALPRGQAAPVPPPQPHDDKWLDAALKDALVSERLAGNAGDDELTERFGGYTIAYRVRISGDKLVAEYVSSEWRKKWTWVAGIGLSVLAVGGGFAWLRRRKRAPAQ